jgi:hypothetical protein
MYLYSLQIKGDSQKKNSSQSSTILIEITSISSSTVYFLVTRVYKVVLNALRYRSTKMKRVCFISVRFPISAVVNGALTARMPAAAPSCDSLVQGDKDLR